ncbi:hypothetical protein HYPSUDRAFT_618641 [Hypholoma sublateritium FD-334 SS-4]|uniref:BTB domain-containing protein n=1 Tax=Hypholoma sublateritium (strain FD-334 SS-4) TaxID=945553 RepID=A0A0D2MXH4_HYPSF|nr:hypothetical protein HYPSUDRAFT_618641 [Hypholoma sublateritium FD-334 SS-4]
MSSTQVNGTNGDYENENQRLDEVTPNAQEQCRKDELYYFELVVFKVEDTLFRVPKSIFNVKDSVIGDMFLLPNIPNNSGLTQGSTDESPIVFEDKSLMQIGVEPIKKADFRALLRVMIPLNQTPLTYEEWVGVLHLSSMWFYTEIRARAIVNLTTFIARRDVCSNILLAKKYGVRQWLIDGYTDLVLQPTSPILDELCATGIDPLTLARIYYIRDVLPPLAPSDMSEGHTCTSCGRSCEVVAGTSTDIGHYCGSVRTNFDPYYRSHLCTGSNSPSDADRETYRQSAQNKITEVFSSEFTHME